MWVPHHFVPKRLSFFSTPGATVGRRNISHDFSHEESGNLIIRPEVLPELIIFLAIYDLLLVLQIGMNISEVILNQK